MGIQTQICALLLLLTILILKILQPQTNTKKHKTFSILLASGIICLVLDGYSIIVIKNACGEYGFFEHIICRSYLASLDFMATMSFIYLTTDLKKHIRHISKVRKFSIIWAALFIILNYTLPLQFYDKDGMVFTFDSAVYATYGLAATILISNIVILLRYKNSMNSRRWLAGMLWMIIWIGATVIQLMRNELLLVGYGCAIGIMIVFIKMETPDYQNLMKTMEQLEESRKEADQANKAKSNFLAQMSHEIRTPINAVLGMNEMILREAKDETILFYASNAYNSGKALLSIINDILDISKIEAGKLEIVNSEYDLHSLVSDCYHMTAERAEKKGLEFNYKVEETLPSKLLGDMFHLRQIVVNFITNSIKYTDKGSIELLFSGIQKENEFVLSVSVKDTGIGLTVENMEKLFTSFQRFDLKRNQNVEGTGLGLSICKQLAELMGGTVQATSTYGKGSTFYCKIPQQIIDSTPIGNVVLEKSIKTKMLTQLKKFTAQKANILVVDDVDINLVVFSTLLKDNKINIDEATSGKMCLDLIQKKKYDIIFMDHMMPKMDGIETFRRIKETEHLNKNTPVIMLTANAISGEKERYLSEGFVSYLTKPIQSDKLEENLLRYLPKEKIVWEEISFNDETTSNKTNIFDLQKEQNDFFDTNLGLKYAGNNQAAYTTILNIYVKTGKQQLESIAQFCKDELWNDYINQVHALKSSSLTVGSKQLSEFAKELESAGKQGNYELIKEKNAAMLELYQKVIDAVTKTLEEINKTTPTTTTEEPKQLKEIAAQELKKYDQKIQNAAQAFDGDEIAALCDELSHFSFNGKPLAEKFSSVKVAAKDFECEKAEEIAKQIFTELFQ